VALDLGRFEALTFDCFGTLIDWESGILNALRPLLGNHGAEPDDEKVLRIYAGLESELERGPYRTYRMVLREVVRGFGRRFGFEPSADEVLTLEDSLPLWPAFPDTVAALAALGRTYRLAVISNVDDDLFADTAKTLGDPFEIVVTAEQVGAYKPSPVVFDRAIELIGTSQDAVLHVAQSLYHDIEPALGLGLATVWVNRRGGKVGFGATPESAAVPDLTVPDLETLAKLALEGPVS
jgi:2-haloacid dehalogenase